MPQAMQPGFFGKLPSAGDFVQRRLPPAFVEPWDRHFSQLIAGARDQLGTQWAPAYRGSGLHAFVLGSGLCGAGAWAGVLGPGEDRVGRCFPLAIALPLAQAAPDRSWYARAATLLGQALADRTLGVEAFDAQLQALAPDPDATAIPNAPRALAGQALWWSGDGVVQHSVGLLSAHDYLGWLAPAALALPEATR
ncbi:type VI secretion system-associated protein TagF [Xanthomonas sp. CFBP 8703]|uniref:Type VI secretion system-associated protein TagF n=2 Tax=Xanthomonas bonasiae TaxID=2810351 RepID=A0ABS3B2T3_9XANT|nr:type VI secretion system-associated protein TagF [Xanthomonas surreyensis]MBN6102359.1 type VI secretion system-associated protein TagF [Xanthomonas bonasiae]